MRTIYIIAAIGMATLSANPALAAGEEESQVRTIRVADLDLGSAQGRTTLDRRIARAVEGVCGSYSTATSMTAEDRISACRKSAISGIHRRLAASGARVEGGATRIAAIAP